MTDQTYQTSVHDLPVPVEGYDASDPSYAALVNDILEELDAGVPLRGPVADRPSVDVVPDRAWYHATDQGVIYEVDPDAGWSRSAGPGLIRTRSPSNTSKR